ncbi:BppU family phage baseplate upper protein [Enterococcus malodoratus]|uniref:BppU family phage baseplate upper protein n=1 Tax=Enterococcus malodoratus TaxID=71451 RepID=UPI0039AF91F7
MFKTKEEVIVIQAEATDPITTGVVFWSHDKGTAKLLFQLKKGTVSQTLAKGTIVPICLVFNGGRHIYHAVIEDAVNGIVSIVLEDNILGYVGRVEGSIYIELPDSRSLDTAGRFTFDIKRSPIDENVPELKDYYWQGFNEIMAQYHQTIATIKLEAKALLDSLTTDVTKVKNDIATANVKIAEIRKKLDDNDVFTKAESSANVINSIGGVTSATFIDSFRVDGVVGTAARDKEGVPIPFSKEDYDDINSADKFVRSETIVNGRGAEMIFEFPVIKNLEEKYPFIFEGLSSDDEKQVRYLEVLKSVDMSQFSRGGGVRTDESSGINYARPYIKNLNNGFLALSSWANTTGNFVKFSGKWNEARTTLVQSNGSYIVFVTSNKNGSSDGGAISNGTIPAWIEVMNLQLIIELEVNGRTIIESMIAANHRENLATQEEAETGTDNAKTMTPLRTAQQIDEKAVSIVGNQTVLGTKDFQDGILVAGKKPVLTKATTDYAITDSTVNPAMFGGGYIKLYRRGDLVYLTASFKLAVEKFNQGVWFNPPDWARPIDNARFNLKREDNTNALFIFNSPGNGDNTIICSDNIAANTWLNGSASWMARDPY